MSKRLASLDRIQAVQAQMVRLAEWKLATATRDCRALGEDKTRLAEYVSDDGLKGESALGVSLARAALKTIHVVDRKLGEAERAREVETERLAILRRREKTTAAMREDAAILARRAAEDRDLAQTLDAWIAARSASLP